MLDAGREGPGGTTASELAALRPPLVDLVSRIREVVGRGLSDQQTADAVGRELRPVLAVPDLLGAEQRRGSADGYTQHLLHVEPGGSFSVVALVWLPGQATAVHDHVSWCTVGVYQGCESEVRYRITGPPGRQRAVETGSGVSPAGTVSALAPPGDVHRVLNCGTSTAISLHVYGADVGVLGSSIRRTYQEAG